MLTSASSLETRRRHHAATCAPEPHVLKREDVNCKRMHTPPRQPGLAQRGVAHATVLGGVQGRVSKEGQGPRAPGPRKVLWREGSQKPHFTRWPFVLFGMVSVGGGHSLELPQHQIQLLQAVCAGPPVDF